jgi:hypothetical protein
LCFFTADFFERVSRIFLLGNYKKVCHLLKWKLSHRWHINNHTLNIQRQIIRIE